MSLRIVGKISGYHGVKGEIKVYPLVDDLNYFHIFDSLIIEGKKYKLVSSREHKDWVLVKLDGFDSLNQVESLSGYIEAELEEDLEDNEIYIQDLIGLDVIDRNSNKIGLVSGFSDIGQELISIKLNEKFSKKNEILVPFVDQYILEIAQDKSYIRVDLTEDLLDLVE